MTSTPDREPTLQDLANGLKQLISDQQSTNERLRALTKDLEISNSRMDKWEKRFFQLSRDNLIIARTVIIAAASVVILGSVLDKAEVLILGLARLLGKA
ncbi:hypothetical protein GS597_07500 [Synechococcales cyanobacterium C]|uniref:Uncharacterized protein n=1 Tax=Petrachloros mirabilis ULC683 TaxID=2781853 RepID=A0A8K1ZYJ3_9CYAN|nr:hypothetical protein [Petrachloros mirabilis]NCJ06356.1 hypothetical protein [Petrachloros mirabilis ULC683]